MKEYTNGNHMRQLTRRQREALPHLLSPGSISEKARNAGVSRNTLYRWLRDVNFRRTLQEASADVMKVSQSYLQLASTEAVAVLFRALEDERPHIRLRAAQTIVKLGHDSRFGEQLEEKLNNMEDAIQLKEELKSTHA